MSNLMSLGKPGVSAVTWRWSDEGRNEPMGSDICIISLQDVFATAYKRFFTIICTDSY